jgi:protein SCO1
LYANTTARNYLLLAAMVLVALASGVGCHRTNAGEQGASQATSSALASAALTDQDGRALTLADFRGKTLVFSFFFTSCPSVCPLETRALSEVQRRLSPALKERVRFVSLSVDPHHDTPEALKRFALANGADLSDWSFVRASEQATRAVTKEFAAFESSVKADAAASGHTTAAYLFDANGRLMQRYAGSPLDAPRLAREIEQLDAWLRKKKAT